MALLIFTPTPDDRKVVRKLSICGRLQNNKSLFYTEKSLAHNNSTYIGSRAKAIKSPKKVFIKR